MFSVGRVAPFLGVTVVAGLLYILLPPGHDVGYFEDDAMYIVLARSMGHGRYADLSSVDPTPESQYLPGFPALLAPFVIHIPSQWNALKAVATTLATLGCGLAALFFWRSLPTVDAVIALALFAWNPTTRQLSDLLLSEWLMLCLTLAALFLLTCAPSLRRRSWSWVLTFLLSWAALTRPEGILFVTALGIAMVFCPVERRWAMILVPLAVWLGWTLRNELIAARFSSYPNLWTTPNTTRASAVVSGLLSQVLGLDMSTGRLLRCVTVGPALLLAILGAWFFCARARRLATCTLVGYTTLFCGLHFAWTVNDMRFYLCVLPLVLLLIFAGARPFTEHHQAWRQGLRAAFAGLAVVGLVNSLHQGFVDRRVVGPFYHVPRATMAAIKNHMAPGQPILSNKPATVYLYTGHPTVQSMDARTPDDLRYQLMKAGSPPVLIERQPISAPLIQRQWARLDRYLHGWPTAFPVLYQNADERTTIYQVMERPACRKAYESYLNARQSIQKGDRGTAIAILERAIAFCPDFPAALNDEGALLLEIGQTDRAEHFIKAALTLRPGFALARLNFARALRRQGDVGAAREQLRYALQTLDPDDSLIRGWIEEEKNRS